MHAHAQYIRILIYLGVVVRHPLYIYTDMYNGICVVCNMNRLIHICTYSHVRIRPVVLWLKNKKDLVRDASRDTQTRQTQ